MGSCMQLCLIMATVGLENFHSKAIILQGAAFLQRSGSCAESFISPAQSLQFTVIFLMPKKTPLDHPVWASSESFDQNPTEIGSEPEAALEGLDNQVGATHPLCWARGPRTPGKSCALRFPVWALVRQLHTTSQRCFRVFCTEAGKSKVHVFCIPFITVVFG